jgi:chromate transporter
MIKSFLKDVFICSLSAFGGPEAHYGVFTKQLVEKKGYLTADELLEWMALTSLLPGPSSTQTITAIGYQKGGIKLAFLTLMVWALPIVLIMIGLTFLVTELSEVQAVIKSVAALGWMAIGFLVFGAYKISKKALVSRITVWLFLVSFTLSLFIRSFYIFPVLLVGSGLIHTLFKPSASKDRLVIKWNVPLLIGILSLVGWGLIHPYLGAVPLIQLSSLFTGFGSLVLGGGNVVIPYMYETLVEGYGWISSEDFLAGLGLIQGMPGPMFSFSAWVAGLSFQENPFIQVSAGLTGALFLFLPGTLFIFLVAPVWNQVRLSPQIKPALKGVLAAAAGLVVSTALLILFATEIDFTSGLLIGVTLVLLGLKKIPVPLILVIILGLGILL